MFAVDNIVFEIASLLMCQKIKDDSYTCVWGQKSSTHGEDLRRAGHTHQFLQPYLCACVTGIIEIVNSE